MYLGKTVLVLGMAKSGIASAELLLSDGAKVRVNDQKTLSQFDEETQKALLKLMERGAELLLGEPCESLFSGVHTLVISPGVPIEHPAVAAARKLGISVIGELELAYRLSQGKVLAITGTNGKTTTTTLVGEICKAAGNTTYVVGNIGTPYAKVAEQTRAGDDVVVEVSSFQLESIERFHPSVAAVLNLTEDHMNRHKTFERYASLKARVFENMKDGDAVVLNYDDAGVRAMAKTALCKVVYFSRMTEVPFGAFVKDGQIVFGTPAKHRAVCAVSELKIPGEHNLENALAAAAIALSADLPLPAVQTALRSFEGVEHRIEYVRTVDGARYINDSKGTNVDSTVKAVRAMKAPTVIILGGSEKKADYRPLVEEMKKGPITDAVLIGYTADAIEEALRAGGFLNIHRAGSDFQKAILMCRDLAADGGNVLLSPACASFDMFSCFEERGEIFKKIVGELSPRRA